MTTIRNESLSVIKFDGARLAFPLAEVVGMQRISALEENSEIPLALGSVIHGGRRWPVFGLGGDFELLFTLPAQRMHCICLSADGVQTGLALACDTISTIALGPDLEPLPIPICIQRADSPLRTWCWWNEKILPVSSTPTLITYFKGLMEQRDD